jgi:LysM repeat protein
MKTKIFFLIFFSFSLILIGCSPLKSSPQEEKHQLELTLHEVQTNLDDLRHDINCFQTELQIIDGKIKHQDSTSTMLKKQFIEKQEINISLLSEKAVFLEKKFKIFEETLFNISKDITQLSNHANSTSHALTQYRDRINELEKDIISHNKKIAEFAKIKHSLKSLTQALEKSNKTNVYKVKSGDSLEKIAKENNISVNKIKKINNLDKDLIVIGQELEIINE